MADKNKNTTEVARQKVEEAARVAVLTVKETADKLRQEEEAKAKDIGPEKSAATVLQEVGKAAEVVLEKVAETVSVLRREEEAAGEAPQKVKEAAAVARLKLEKAAMVAHRMVVDTAEEIKERLQLFIDGVKDYAILMLDVDGYVTSWNEGAKRLKGWDTQGILGCHFSQFYTEEAVAAHQPEQELEIARTKGRYAEEGWRTHPYCRHDGSRFHGRRTAMS